MCLNVLSMCLGACGNVCSALFAVRMGLPLDIVVANNSNAFFRTIYHTGKNKRYFSPLLGFKGGGIGELPSHPLIGPLHNSKQPQHFW